MGGKEWHAVVGWKGGIKSKVEGKEMVERNFKFFIGCLIAILVSLIGHNALAIDKTPTGFYYPIGTSQFSSACGTWLGRDSANGGCYFDGYYHIGVDMMVAENSPVYAISDGIVTNISTNGWGTGNVGVVIKHKLADGSELLALYGHVKTNVAVGNSVTGGTSFATIGYYSYGNHLQFGIYSGTTIPSSNWGLMPNSSWSSTNGFVEPINWITTKTPFSTTPTNKFLTYINPDTTNVYWIQNSKKYHVTYDGLNNMQSGGIPGWSWSSIYTVSNSYTSGPEFISTGSASNGLYIRKYGGTDVYKVNNGKKDYVSYDSCN